jgi:transposase
MHVGGRCSDDIDAGGMLPEFTGILMRDGYAGYAHLPAIHAGCGAHLLRDLRAVSDADPDGQIWASAMANTLLEANQAAHHARAADTHRLPSASELMHQDPVVKPNHQAGKLITVLEVEVHGRADAEAGPHRRAGS